MNDSDFKIDHSKMEYFFNPRTIAIIGASSDFRKPGGRSLNALQKRGYTGKIYPINPNSRELLGIPCYPKLADVPDEIDMAIISTPAHTVLEKLEQCVDKKVKATVVFTSGFAEAGPEGAALQQRMTELAQKNDLRILGPNCVGIVNLSKSVMACFANIVDLQPVYPMTFGFVTQSGAFGTMIFSQAVESGVGFNAFVSVGNEADTEFADYLAYMLTNPETKLVGGYLEGAKDGTKLRRAAQTALELKKPVMIMKVGRTGAGARAASSHTGSLAGNDQVYDAFFRQMGIIRLEALSELTSFVIVHRSGRIPKGNNIGILSISGGAGVLMADRSESLGLGVPEFKGETRRRLESYLPPYGSAKNPVDLTATAVSEPQMLGKCLKALVADENIHMIALAMGFMPHMAPVLAKDIIEVYNSTDKPIVLATYVFNPSEAVLHAIETIKSAGVPVLTDHLHAVGALKNLSWYAGKLRDFEKASAKTKTLKISPSATTIERLASSAPLAEYEAKEILKDCGIAITRESLATSAAMAVRMARAVGYPVALKIQSPQIPHKTEADGIRLNVRSDAQVRAAFKEIIGNARKFNPEADIHGVLVQEMAGDGLEIIVGTTRDPVFGHVVMFGLGGIFVEALKDISLRVAPVSRGDAKEMIREIRGYSMLQGMRGRPPVDFQALTDVILRVSKLVSDYGDAIEELDINPLLVFEKGVKALDALIIKK
ncbi:MAG: CoA-binding protein [Smithella sp.]|jgi:acetyltransferase|nr:CoA-binding protein [Smithella sp.]